MTTDRSWPLQMGGEICRPVLRTLAEICDSLICSCQPILKFGARQRCAGQQRVAVSERMAGVSVKQAGQDFGNQMRNSVFRQPSGDAVVQFSVRGEAVRGHHVLIEWAEDYHHIVPTFAQRSHDSAKGAPLQRGV